MLRHRFRRHRSAVSIVREYLGPQLAVIPEELLWMPAHPSSPDDGGFTYQEILQAVRKQRLWAFVRVPKKGLGEEAVIHFFAARDVPLVRVAWALGHELGHLSGRILEDEAAEERRADRYGEVAERVFEVLSGLERTSSGPDSGAGTATRPGPSVAGPSVRRKAGAAPTRRARAGTGRSRGRGRSRPKG